MHQGTLRVPVRADPGARPHRSGAVALAEPVRATGIVLAGGRSSRFGRDKMSEPYRGLPLLHHAVLRVSEACSEVVVVLAPGETRPHLPPAPALRLARDATEWRGPLAGLSAGLAETRTDLAMVVGGDMPDLSPGVLREMLMSLAGGQAGPVVEAVALRDSGSLRPLPLAVRTVPVRRATATLLREGEGSLVSLLAALRTLVLEEERWVPLDTDKATLRDVDVPDDLQA